MALEGTFRDFHIADVMQLIGLQRKTGTLLLEGEEDSLTLLFQDGAIVAAQSARAPWEQRLARTLVRRGLLTSSHYDQVLAAQRETGHALGPLLVERGLVPAKEWEALQTIEIEEALYRPFRWRTGRYRFISQAAVEIAGGRVGPIGAEALLMEGLRRADEWPLIVEQVPGAGAVFRLATRAGKLRPSQISEAEVKMLSLVDGKSTVQELVEASGLREFEAWQGLANLVKAGAIQVVAPVPASSPAVAQAAPPPRPAPGLALGASPPWVGRAAWGLAALWLLFAALVFRVDPLGVIPLSGAPARSLNQVRVLRAQRELTELVGALERYTILTGVVPTSLDALVGADGSLLDRLRDPWGHLYLVRPAGGSFSVLSTGPDGRTGTPDDVILTDD